MVAELNQVYESWWNSTSWIWRKVQIAQIDKQEWLQCIWLLMGKEFIQNIITFTERSCSLISVHLQTKLQVENRIDFSWFPPDYCRGCFSQEHKKAGFKLSFQSHVTATMLEKTLKTPMIPMKINQRHNSSLPVSFGLYMRSKVIMKNLPIFHPLVPPSRVNKNLLMKNLTEIDQKSQIWITTMMQW